MKRPRIVVTHRLHDAVAERLRARGELDMNTAVEPWSADALGARLATADALMGFMTDRVDAAVLAAAPRLRVVACALKGHDSYDEAACTRAGVWLSIVPDLLTAPTAELAIGLAIGLARHVRDGDAEVRSGAFRGWRARHYGTGLDGATVSIVGLGAVGRAIAARLTGFGCAQLLGVDPAGVPAGFERATLERAMRESHYVFLAAPLTCTNVGAVNAALLEAAHPGLLLVNVGRGSVVDEDAVAAALAAGRLGGYAADVFAFEDWALAGRPAAVPARLRAAPRTLFTPHLGSAVASVRLAIEHRAADNILAVLAGQAPPDAINRPLRARSAA